MFVIGATNYIGKLDSAILRTGRLDSVIYLGMPDEAAIMDILRKSLKKSQLQCVWLVGRIRGVVNLTPLLYAGMSHSMCLLTILRTDPSTSGFQALTSRAFAREPWTSPSRHRSPPKTVARWWRT